MDYNFAYGNYVYPQFTAPNFSGMWLNPTIDTTGKSSSLEDDLKSPIFTVRRKAEEKRDAENARKYIEEQQRKAEEDRNKPLTKAEANILRRENLESDAKNNKKEQSSITSAMLLPALFTASAVKKGIRSKANIVEMFYKDGAAHMDLFKQNPELMTNAQDAIQKLEQKFARDIKAAKGNATAISKITAERDLFRDVMQKALDGNNAQEIANATSQCQAAAGVKNGWFRRLIRGMKKQDKLVSRFDSVASQQFKPATVPASGKSFWKNMFGSKLSTGIAVSMLILPIISDWENIKQSKAIDKENKANGKETHHGRKQIPQTSLKAAASFVSYSVVDTAVRTVSKRMLGKFAAKLAAKIAVKGGCKAIGAVAGSVVPGIGNVLGIIAGTELDFVLNKYVFGNMKFFNNSGIKEAQVEKASDEELLTSVSDAYMKGEEVSSEALRVLQKKSDPVAFKELKKIHNMSDDARNKYLAQLQQQMASGQGGKQIATA